MDPVINPTSEISELESDTTSEISEVESDPVPFARCYQLEALEKSIRQNTIVFLETGSGKTLIAIMLLRSFAHLIRKPSPYIAVFLVPTVVLVSQQGEAIKRHTDMKIGKYWGDMGVDYWDATTWMRQVQNYEVLIMTPAILLAALRHSFLKIDMIKILIFDECHNARGNHPYSCIMKEFYHRQLHSRNVQLPRIFGMTASPIKAKGSSSPCKFWKGIRYLENLMNSKVYTCASESVLAAYIAFPTAKVKTYNFGVTFAMFESIKRDVLRLRAEHDLLITKSNLSEFTAESARRRLVKLESTFLFCLGELGIFLALKAAQSLSCDDKDPLLWGKLDLRAETAVRGFSLDAAKIFSFQMPSGAQWHISNLQANTDAGYITPKVLSLVETLLSYRDIKELRCIVFVERVVTAIVLRSLLNELLPRLTGWKTEYTAGNKSVVQPQSRKAQNKVVEEFRKGMVNIIVATSMLEEGLDVQSCNLVIRFDPSATVCSFIQSRGRARMQNSEFILMVKSGDDSTLAQVNNYLASGEIMRKESLCHASLPCAPLDIEQYDEYSYRVETTGAIVNLRSSISLLYLYCSKLPSDRYFKPDPICDIDKDQGTCVLNLPRSCQIQTVRVQGDVKILKQLACLEACKQLHQAGALTDNLVPNIMEEIEAIPESGCVLYNDEQARYFPPELIDCRGKDQEALYHCYLIDLQDFSYNGSQLQNIILAVGMKLGFGNEKLTFELNVDGDHRVGHLSYIGLIKLTSEKIHRCQVFQALLLRALLHHNLNKLGEALDRFGDTMGSASFDYLLLPSMGSSSQPSIDWKIIDSILFPTENPGNKHTSSCCMQDCNLVHTKNGLVFSCWLENSLVCTPHNGKVYFTTGFLHNLDGNSTLKMRSGGSISYKGYFKKRNVDLLFEKEALLHGKYLPTVQNYLLRCSSRKAKEPSNSSVELPPELCSIITSMMPYGTLCSFSYIPSIMHRIESLLIAVNLKKMVEDHCMQNVMIPTNKILEAITTKKCQETFHLESLETLGDSFLKYAASQQLFTAYHNDHEGLLSVKKDKMVSNAALCKLACNLKIPGFIRTEPFDPKTWVIPGDYSQHENLDLEILSPSRKMYSMGKRNIKGKRVADVVEALIGAYVSTAGEQAALSFMTWIGLDIHFVKVPKPRHFPVNAEKFVHVQHLENLLNYKFHDPSLLVEALTHGSYMISEIPVCYQRLEFIGDAVLDYVITTYLYDKHPGLSPGLLTDLRSCSVNNDCYALCAIKADLQKHILYASNDLHGHIASTVESVTQLSISSTFGWELDTSFPKVLGDVIESLAGAIFIDSCFNKDKVRECILPLLEPIVTPETVRLHPSRELNELCQRENYTKKKSVTSRDGVAYITMEVEANGLIYRDSCSARDKHTADKLACRHILKKLNAKRGGH